MLKHDYVVSIYLVGQKYNWANFSGQTDISRLSEWGESLRGKNLNGIIFHNCFSENDINKYDNDCVKFININTPNEFMSGLYRFDLYNEFITANEGKINNIWFTDSTDLTVLKNPATQNDFDANKIYIGYEPILRCQNFMVMNFCKDYEKYIRLIETNSEFANGYLLNAGLIGGSISAIKPFIKRMVDEINLIRNIDYQDMPIVNYLAFTEFKDSIMFGKIVNTLFGKHEVGNKISWFKHK